MSTNSLEKAKAFACRIISILSIKRKRENCWDGKDLHDTHIYNAISYNIFLLGKEKLVYTQTLCINAWRMFS